MKTTEKLLRKERFTSFEDALDQGNAFQLYMTFKGYMTSSRYYKGFNDVAVTIHHKVKEEPKYPATFKPTRLYRHEWYNDDTGQVCAATTYYFEVNE